VTHSVAEGLRFCLPFWDIRVPGNQFTTEVLLIGLDDDHKGVKNYLESYAAGQRGQVLGQVVPTGQDSLILISRIAHGASYYWHAQDETYLREYAVALQAAPYPVHLCEDWRRLPEPIPDPRKYQRRVFALGIAYEFIAVRGAAYYYDPSRRYSLVSTARQNSCDWKTIPLLEAAPVAGYAQPAAPPIVAGQAQSTAVGQAFSNTAQTQSAAGQALTISAQGHVSAAAQQQAPSGQPAFPLPAEPATEDLLHSASRVEAMERFIDIDDRVAALRDELSGLFNRQGRDATRLHVERYCREVLDPAISELPADDRRRYQLENELAELLEVIDELKPVAGTLILSR
jgi:hypothetical protein